MWKKEICQICSLVILGGGACTASYFAWKNDIFKSSKNNVVSGTNNSKEEALAEEISSDINQPILPDFKVETEEQAHSITSDSTSINEPSDQQEQKITFSTEETIVIASEVEKETIDEATEDEEEKIDDISEDEQERIKIQTQDVFVSENNPVHDEKSTVFYSFFAYDSCLGSDCFSTNYNTSKYSIDILDSEENTVETIDNVNIFHVLDGQAKKLTKSLIIDDQLYLIEINKSDEQKLLDNKTKKMEILFNDVDVLTHIQPNDLAIKPDNLVISKQ